MLNYLGIFFTIIGTILGCGFFSGKEIVVFFSRFGYWSFLGVLLLFFILFFIFKFLLNFDTDLLQKIQKSKIFLAINLFVCFVFSSAMFASLNETTVQFNIIFKILFFLIIVLSCFLILIKGSKTLAKFNVILVPFMIIVFLILLMSNTKLSLPVCNTSSVPFVSAFYSVLYCSLNVASSGLVIVNLGKNLSREQRTRIAFLSAFVLMIILFFANIILLQNQDSFGSTMPFMSIFSVWQNVVLKINIILGAGTTLFSLTYNFYISLRGLCNNFYIFFISVVLPFIFSFWGFGNIVSYLYPIASIFSIFMLFVFYFEKYNFLPKSINYLRKK